VTPTLPGFYAVMGSFLDGDRSAAQVAEALGPSPSGLARLALYGELVRRQRQDVLDTLFSAVDAACRCLDAGLWGEFTRTYLRVHPPTHPDPSRWGEHMAGFLAKSRATDPTLPLYLEELADYAYVRFAASVAPAPCDGVGLETALFVRRYAHDVAGFTRAVEAAHAEGDAAPPAPRPVDLTILVGWSRVSQRLLELHPSLAALVALGRRVGEPFLPREGGPTEADVDAADRHLVSLGLLAAPPS
jgi:hypothetical protein